MASATPGIRHTILRLSRVYGPGMTRGALYDLMQDFRARRPANMYAHPDSVFGFVYVRDVVSALLLAGQESWDGVTANISPFQGCPSVEVLVNDRARALGWEPHWPLEDGIEETWRHFESNGQ